MKKHLLALALAAAALLFTGCLPEEFIWWSPDGQTAAIRASDGLRLASTNGRLSEVVLTGDIHSAAWLPDGSNLLVSRSFRLTNWAAAAQLIPADEAAATLQMARAVPDLLKAGLTASGGSWADLTSTFIEPLGITDSTALEPAWNCAVLALGPQLLAVAAAFTNAAELTAEVRSAQTNGIAVHELAVLTLRNGRPAGEPRSLVRSLRPLVNPLLCPRYPILSYQTGDGVLKALTLDGKRSLLVAPDHTVASAWSADGRSLFHIEMTKSDKIGEIRSGAVLNDIGQLLQDPPKTETLALAVFASEAAPRLAVLPNGRILFATVPVSLPTPASGLSPRAQFFLLDPAQPSAPVQPVKITEGTLPDDLSAFALSPDGRHVAVVEGNTDAVAVLELATGEVRIISSAHPGCKSRLIPAWRTAAELSFAGLPSPAAPRPELILWRPDAPTRLLSPDWPEFILKPWLEAPGKPTADPAK